MTYPEIQPGNEVLTAQGWRAATDEEVGLPVALFEGARAKAVKPLTVLKAELENAEAANVLADIYEAGGFGPVGVATAVKLRECAARAEGLRAQIAQLENQP